MAGKKEKSWRMAEDYSQVVIAFHRCPLWPFSQKLHLFAFSTSKMEVMVILLQEKLCKTKYFTFYPTVCKVMWDVVGA